MPITHAFTSAKSDGADTTLVRASNWNASHKGQVTARILTDITVVNSTAFVDATGFSFAIAASEVWHVQMDTMMTLGGTEKGKTTWTVPAGATGTQWFDSSGIGGSINPIGTDLILGAVGGATFVITVYSTIINSTTAGTCQWRFAQWQSGSNPAILQNDSVMIATKL